MPAPLDQTRRAGILAAIQAAADGTDERSAAAIAREHGVGKTTVHRIAKAHGLERAWERSQTAAASRAKAVDNRARRAALSTAMLEDAERLRDRVWSPAVVVSATGSKVTLDLPPAGDVRAFTGSITGLVKSSLEVDKRDAEDDSHAAVDEWLRGLMPHPDDTL